MRMFDTTRTPTSFNQMLFWFLTLVYICAILLSYTTAQRLYGGGKMLTHVHQAWFLEAVPWTVACITVFVLARLRIFRQANVQMAVLLCLSFGMTIWLVFQPPAYSNDVFRYLWDGRLLRHGINPYSYVPLDAHLAHLHQWPYWSIMNWKSWPEAYPPLAQIYFGAIALLTNGTLLSYKTLLLINDAASIWLFYQVLRKRRQLAGGQTLTDKDVHDFSLFVLFPPILIESFGSGHVDLFAIPWLLLGWLWYLQGNSGRVGFAIAMAACIKTYPIVLLAAFINRRNGKVTKDAKKMLGACVVSLGVLYALFSSAGSGLFAFYTKVKQMGYNGSLEYVLGKWFGPTIDDHATLIIVIAELVMWLLVLFTQLNQWTVERKVCLLGLTFLLASPVLHSWYMLALLPFAIVADDLATIWLSITSHFVLDEVPLDMYVEYLPTYVLLFRQLLRREARSGTLGQV